VLDGVVHYCVTNMPGAVAGTSTYALTNETQPYVRLLENRGWRQAMRENEPLKMGLNIAEGKVCFPAIAEQYGLPSVVVDDLIG